MGRPIVATSTMNRVKYMADQCLEHKRPVGRRYTVEEEGNIERCKALARGVQQTFTAMRAQHRGQVLRDLKRQDAANVPAVVSSPYDRVSCRYAPMSGTAAGYEVIFELVTVDDVVEELLFMDTGTKLVEDEDGITAALKKRIDKDVKSVTAAEIAERPTRAILLDHMEDVCLFVRQTKWFQDEFKPEVERLAMEQENNND